MSKPYPGNVLEEFPNPLPLLLDTPRTQQELGGVSRQTIYRLVEDGKLRRVKLGRSVRFRREDVLALIEEATR